MINRVSDIKISENEAHQRPTRYLWLHPPGTCIEILNILKAEKKSIKKDSTANCFADTTNRSELKEDTKNTD